MGELREGGVGGGGQTDLSERSRGIQRLLWMLKGWL